MGDIHATAATITVAATMPRLTATLTLWAAITSHLSALCPAVEAWP